MIRKIRLYFRLIAVSVRMQMQHRASFIMLTLALFLSSFMDIFGIWVLFDRFKMIQQWTLKEVALLYGIMNMSFALAEMSAKVFDNFSQMVKRGDFDRVLLRPLGTLFQIASSEIQIMRIGRFLQGAVILNYGFREMDLSFFSFQTLVILLTIMSTSCVFYGLFILQATLSFWTTETLELMNIVTYGGLESGQYPLSIYTQSFRFFFTFIIPLGCVAYYPLATALRLENFPLWTAAFFPLSGILFLYLCCQVWKLGVRHYHSTGS
ncbi:MAG: ABC-2 family transporter protein [Parachlamydiaceae bacterium]|nr:ABC-2 family transporter protein [Parachlamydiaceae bacterium]